MIRLSGVLLLVALVCGAILAVMFQHTSPVIEEQKQIVLERSLQSVIKADRYEKKKTEWIITKRWITPGR
jgi:hypothetical protein